MKPTVHIVRRACAAPKVRQAIIAWDEHGQFMVAFYDETNKPVCIAITDMLDEVRHAHEHA